VIRKTALHHLDSALRTAQFSFGPASSIKPCATQTAIPYSSASYCLFRVHVNQMSLASQLMYLRRNVQSDN